MNKKNQIRKEWIVVESGKVKTWHKSGIARLAGKHFLQIKKFIKDVNRSLIDNESND